MNDNDKNKELNDELNEAIGDVLHKETKDVKTFGIVGIVISLIIFALICYFIVWLVKRLTRNKSAFSYRY